MQPLLFPMPTLQPLRQNCEELYLLPQAFLDEADIY
jgi:hypothetical protein